MRNPLDAWVTYTASGRPSRFWGAFTAEMVCQAALLYLTCVTAYNKYGNPGYISALIVTLAAQREYNRRRAVYLHNHYTRQTANTQ